MSARDHLPELVNELSFEEQTQLAKLLHIVTRLPVDVRAQLFAHLESLTTQAKGARRAMRALALFRELTGEDEDD